MKNQELVSYIRNRKLRRGIQIKFWRSRWRSGVMRGIERLMSGSNVSDRLAGNGIQLAHIPLLKTKIIAHEIYSRPRVLKDLEVKVQENRRITISAVKGPVYKIILREGIVSLRDGSVWFEDGFILDDVLPHWQQLLYAGGLTDSLKNMSRVELKLPGDWTFLPKSNYFYHQFTENLPKALKSLKDKPEIGVIAPFDTTPSLKELLAALPNKIFYCHESIIQVEKLHTVTSARIFTSEDGELLRQFAFNAVPNIDLGQNLEKIYVVRGNLDRGDEKLESRLMERLSNCGFRTIQTESMSISDQIKTFARAEIIISFHGGALTNCIWMPKGNHVLEIFNHPFRTYDFARLATEMELNYVPVELSDTKASTNEKVELVINEYFKICNQSKD